MVKIIGVMLNKGGVGKSSLVTNLGALLADKGFKTLLIDTDSQGNTPLSFGKNPEVLENTLYDVLMDDLEPEKALLKINDTLDILPSNSDSDLFELDFYSEWDRETNPFTLMKEKLNNLVEKYDYVIIDTPPAFTTLTTNALILSDSLVIPFEPDLYSSKGLVRLVKSVEKFKESYNPDLSILGVVPMKIDYRTNVHKEGVAQASKYLSSKGLKMFKTSINRSIVFSDSVFYNSKPAVWSEPNHLAVSKYKELLKEILEELEEG